MIIPDNLYILITIISSVVILLFGCCLIGMAVPPEKDFRNYRIVRKLLAFSFLILGMTGVYELFYQQKTVEISNLMLLLTLIVASIQAALFTFSLITLIDIHFITTKRVLFQIIPIFSMATLLVLAYNLFAPVFKIIYIIGIILYILQLFFYVWLFNRKYNSYVLKLDNYFSGDEVLRMHWIKQAFYMSLSIGILAIISPLAGMLFYIVFIVFYTLFYVYFAMKYINYATIFRQLLPAVKIEEHLSKEKTSKKNNTNISDEEIMNWIKDKKFTHPGITLETLSLELGTNYTYLSRYINTVKNQNFKQWISTLRIEEAKRLLVEYPEKTIQLIGEEVGISSKGSFFRQFLQIEGITPGEFRKKMLK